MILISVSFVLIAGMVRNKIRNKIRANKVDKHHLRGVYSSKLCEDKERKTMSKRIIDIHNHSLCCVDDGAEDLQESVQMLHDAAEQGVEAVILTPHYRHGMFAYRIDDIEKHYRLLAEAAEEIGVALYLGCEYHVNSQVLEAFQTERCRTLAESDYVLTEYSYQTEYSDMVRHTRELLSGGYIPVIAHVERYGCIQKKPALCAELSDMGALIQLNADSILGMEGGTLKRVCRKILKNGWADIVASDAHGLKQRASHIEQCREYVEQKYGEGDADKLFYRNPRRIIENR